MSREHIKDCELGDNWKFCPACVEQHNSTQQFEWLDPIELNLLRPSIQQIQEVVEAQEEELVSLKMTNLELEGKIEKLTKIVNKITGA